MTTKFIDTEDQTLTVAELIIKLQELPPELGIILEGCDCIGSCDGTRISEWEGIRGVILTRGN